MIIILSAHSETSEKILAVIYEEYGKKMLRVACSYLSKEDAEDALHDIMKKLSIKFQKNFSDLCDKRTAYFVTITKNHCIDIIRKQKIEAGLLDFVDDDNIFADYTLDPSSLYEKQSDKELLTACIHALKPNYQEILEYKYILGYANGEIANALNVSASVVSTRLERAKNKLRKIIEERDDI